MNAQQDHKVRFEYIANMYRVNANCKCGWSKDYTIATDTSEIELHKLHYAFVVAGEEMIECPNHEGGFDCTSFCNICEGEQGYYPEVKA